MQKSKNGSSPAVGFFLSVLFFALCVAAGMFFSYHLDTELYDTLSLYVQSALREETGFRLIFSNAAKYDFRYSLIVLVSAFSIYSSFFPLLVVGFKGFSSGLAVAVSARVLATVSEKVAFSSAVFLSSVVTVPLYVLMFMMGYKFALRLRKSTETPGRKIKDYMEFMLLVAICFAMLCIVDLLQASIGIAVSYVLK